MLTTRRFFPHIGALVVTLSTVVGLAQHGPVGPAGAHDRPGQGPPLETKRSRTAPGTSDIRVLPAMAQARMAAAIGEDEATYHARTHGRGYRMDNADHAISAEFTASAIAFRRGANWWGLAMRAYGHGEGLHNAGVTAPVASANRIEYRRSGLTEWYVNGPLGLEQGFTLDRPLEGSSAEPLTLTFALTGNLTPTLSPDGKALVLRSANGIALRYRGLTAWDAAGRDLRTWLESNGHELRLLVDTVGARYPVTIDPYVQGQKLTMARGCTPDGTCDDGAPGDEFGLAVSISADASTVVIGAPYKYTNSVATGAAYVFVKPGDFEGGWNTFYPIRYKAKLLPSDTFPTGRQLGWSVDVSRDGGTIVVGALAAQQMGGGYVFVRPAAGWGSVQVQTQTAKLTALPTSNGFDYGPTFGQSVAISGDGATIAIGAYSFAIDSVYRGTAYVYLRPSTGWIDATETQRLVGTAYSAFASSLSLSDDATILAIGATGENPLGGTANSIGAAHVLSRRANQGGPDSYVAVAKLRPSDGVTRAFFGASISVSGDGRTIAVGAPVNPYETPDYAGAAYVFVRPTKGWGVPSYTSTERAKLTASDSWERNQFGRSIDISADGNTIVTGALEPPDLPGSQHGPSVGYFFAKPPAGWMTSSENTKARREDGAYQDWFGLATTVSGNGSVSIIGAPFETVNANPAQGAAYIFMGSAADPIASVSPSNVTFGSQAVGTVSSAKTVTLSNTGAGPLDVSSVRAIGSFVTTQNCVSASPIAPGSSCAESVAFAPTSTGLLYGAVEFNDNSGGATPFTQYAQLQGTGAKANTSTTISVSSNRVLVGQPVVVSFAVTPEAGSAGEPSGMVIVQASTGESCSVPAQSNTDSCALTFATPATRTITASYGGDASFNQSASQEVSVNAADFQVAVIPGSQVAVGKKVTYTVSVTALNGSTGSVSLSCSGGPPNSTCAASPTSVSLSGTVTAKATVSLPNNATQGIYTITFRASFGTGFRSATATLIVN